MMYGKLEILSFGTSGTLGQCHLKSDNGNSTAMAAVPANREEGLLVLLIIAYNIY